MRLSNPQPFHCTALALVLSFSSAISIHAQDLFESAQSAANFTVGLCLFPSTDDLEGQLAAAKEKALATGLSIMFEDGERGMFGNPSDVFVVVSKTIDSLHCVVQIAPPKGTHDYFETIESAIAVEYQVRFSGFNESIDDDPSPHIDGHGWIFRTPANDSIIVSIDFGTEDGITIGGVAKKEYD
ncbi:MAG: hypothetical protein V3V25_01905 [Paracoccaceae bacterium]